MDKTEERTQQTKESSVTTLSKENLMKHDVSTAGANESSTSVSLAYSVAESERDVLFFKSHDYLGRIGNILNEMKEYMDTKHNIRTKIVDFHKRIKVAYNAYINSLSNPPKLPRAWLQRSLTRRKNRVNDVPSSSSATGTPETVRKNPSASDVNNNDVDNWQKVRSKRQKGKGKQKIVARGRANEAARREDFAVARRNLHVAIRDRKRRCWKQLCDEVDHDVWGKPYRMVMSCLKSPRRISPGEPA
ncbi:hypothetical protein TKK_0018646 [Trichogramma kaykai]